MILENAHPHGGSSSMWSNWNLEMLVFEEGENQSTLRKTSQGKGENQHQTRPTYGVNDVF